MVGGFTAAAGHQLYTARRFPQEYWNRIAFVNEPSVRLVHQAVIEPDGAGFQEKDDWNLLASSDEWFGPVQSQVGPDGAVWVADWYNFIIQHNVFVERTGPFGPGAAVYRAAPGTGQRLRQSAARYQSRTNLPGRVPGCPPPINRLPYPKTDTPGLLAAPGER